MLENTGGALTAELVHAKIMGRAEELANQAYMELTGVERQPAAYKAGTRFSAPPNKRRALSGSGRVFRYDAVQSQRGGLTLSIAENIDHNLTPDERQDLWTLGANAIEDALMEYQDLWVAGILQDALQGTNYFDRFVAVNEQRPLF